MITYEQAKADRDYLFEVYGAAYDMTGGYVEGEKLEELLKRPTKSHARDLYADQICYWFESGYTGDSEATAKRQFRQI